MLRIRNNLRIFSPLGQLPLPPPPPPSEREDLSYFYLFSSFLFYFQTQFTPITSTSLGSVSPPSTGHLCLVSCQVKVFIGHWLTKSKSPFSVFEKTFHIPWTTSNSFLQAIFVRPQLMSKCVLQLSPANVSECLSRDSTVSGSHPPPQTPIWVWNQKIISIWFWFLVDWCTSLHWQSYSYSLRLN